ncbi:MAG TPA: PE domain-containing protein [Pseudonocardiaceae bacterium]|nr:PE domain-containing protein [Pseudonocardiaceae bacterium]
MPLIDGAGIGYWAAQGTSTPAGSFSIEPEVIPQLRADLDDIREQAKEFLRSRNFQIKLYPLGSDPASGATADVHNTKADAAVAGIQGYIEVLDSVIASLDEAAKQYGITEDANTASFQRGATAG